MIYNDKYAAIGHNEDGAPSDFNHMLLLKDIALPGTSNFSAYTYAGDLATGAFGWNNNGIAFTLNAVYPNNSEVVLGGIARGFVSRNLLEANNFDEAMKIITRPGQSVGHNYQIMSLRDKSLTNVEVASRGRYAVFPFLNGSQPYFHVNFYQNLNIPQFYGNSSLHRQARVAQLPPPQNITDILTILGDQADHDYPIFHDYPDNSGSQTVVTVIMNMNNGSITFYNGNPKNGNAETSSKLVF